MKTIHEAVAALRCGRAIPVELVKQCLADFAKDTKMFIILNRYKGIIFPFALLLGACATDSQEAKDRDVKKKTIDWCIEKLEKSEILEVMSLDPLGQAKKGQLEKFRRFSLLGKTTVKDKEMRKAVVKGIRESIEMGDASAFCFCPRHAIRVTLGDETVDFLVCFECSNMHVHRTAGDECFSVAIADAAKAALNSILRKAGIALAPEKGCD